MKNHSEQFDGALLAARYAFMPNKLRYCGGEANTELFEYVCRHSGDPGLVGLLKEFETMHPYLRLIAEANKIFDPFARPVVEAYWIGNELLENVSMKNFYRYLIDEQKLKKKLKPGIAEKIFGKLSAGGKPHHSWHVFNISKRTGHQPTEHSLQTMDDCRVSWGKVMEGGSRSLAGKAMIEYQPLVAKGNRLALGEPICREAWSEINRKSFVKELKPGDWVSLHWGWVCDFLSEAQRKNLEKWTRHNLTLANL